jgi:Na+/pantothenate symporter
VINSLTGLNAIPATVVEVVITLLYTGQYTPLVGHHYSTDWPLLAWGGFRTSLITDYVQGVLILVLLVVCSAAMGANIRIDRSLIDQSGLLKANLLGWQLLYSTS